MTIDIQAVAEEVFSAVGAGQQIKSFTARMPSFNVDDAYRVAAAVRQLRESRGEKVIGRKIGFTNRTIWATYDVYAPIWGFVYDRTAHDLAEMVQLIG